MPESSNIVLRNAMMPVDNYGHTESETHDGSSHRLSKQQLQQQAMNQPQSTNIRQPQNSEARKRSGRRVIKKPMPLDLDQSKLSKPVISTSTSTSTAIDASAAAAIAAAAGASSMRSAGTILSGSSHPSQHVNSGGTSPRPTLRANGRNPPPVLEIQTDLGHISSHHNSISENQPPRHSSPTSSAWQYKIQKLLTRIHKRKRPPTVFEWYVSHAAQASDKDFSKWAQLFMRTKSNAPSMGMDGDADEEEELSQSRRQMWRMSYNSRSDAYYCDDTVEVVIHFRDYLLEAAKEGWNTGELKEALVPIDQKSGRFRRRSRSRSRSPSPSPLYASNPSLNIDIAEDDHLSNIDRPPVSPHTLDSISQTSSRRTSLDEERLNTGADQTDQYLDNLMGNAKLLDYCLYSLSDIISNDCRYAVQHVRPSRPEWILHSVVLDILMFLTKESISDRKALYEIGLVALEAFPIFKDQMAIRLMELMTDFIVPNVVVTRFGVNPTGVNSAGGERSASTTTTPQYTPRLSLISPTSPTKGGATTIATTTAATGAPSASSGQPFAIKVHSPSDDHGLLTVPPHGRRTNPSSPRQGNSFSNSSPTFGQNSQGQQRTLFESSILDSSTTTIVSQTMYALIRHVCIETRSMLVSNAFYKALAILIQLRPEVDMDLMMILAKSDSEVIRRKTAEILWWGWKPSLGHVMFTLPLAPGQYGTHVFDTAPEKPVAQAVTNRARKTSFTFHPTLAQRQSIDSALKAHVADIAKQIQRIPTAVRPSEMSRGLTGTSTSSLEGHIGVVAAATTPDSSSVTSLQLAKEKGSEASISGGASTGKPTGPARDYLAKHEFYPRFFPSNDSNDIHICERCDKVMQGLGMHCYACQGPMHTDCALMVKANTGDGLLARMVLFNEISMFPRNPESHLRPEQKICSEKYPCGSHHFKTVNLFSVTLCAACEKPLWGHQLQAYRCQKCFEVRHLDCLEMEERKGEQTGCSHMESLAIKKSKSITFEEVKVTFREHYAEAIQAWKSFEGQGQLDGGEGLSYEEVSCFASIMAVQVGLLAEGMRRREIVIQGHETSFESLIPTDFELFKMRDYFDALVDRRLAMPSTSRSLFLEDYFEDQLPTQYLLFCSVYWRHFSAVVKTLLRDPEELELLELEALTNIYYTGGLNLAQIKRFCTRRMDIQTPWIMRQILQEWSKIGVLQRVDGELELFPQIPKFTSSTLGVLQLQHRQQLLDAIPCSFPLATAIDPSADVELLIMAISKCLMSLDLTINECGFQLLRRRCWPDGFMSDYTTERLINILFHWLLLGDRQLIKIHIEYVVPRRPLPGVTPGIEEWVARKRMIRMGQAPGQSSLLDKETLATFSEVGSYVLSRQLLRIRYALPWLRKTFDLDPQRYEEMAYRQIRILEREMATAAQDENDHEESAWEFKRAQLDRYFDSLARLKNAGLLFSAFTNLHRGWLDEVQGILTEEGTLIKFKSLNRLFHQGQNQANASKAEETNPTPLVVTQTIIGMQYETPLGTISNLLQGQKCILETNRALLWFELMINGRVNMLPQMFMQCCQVIIKESVPDLDLSVVMLRLCWDQIINSSHGMSERDANEILHKTLMANEREITVLAREVLSPAHTTLLSTTRRLLKYAVPIALYVHGCPVKRILELEVAPITAEFKLSSRVESGVDPDEAEEQERREQELNRETPLIALLLDCLRSASLALQGEMLKCLILLIEEGMLVGNKDEFFESILGILTEWCWEHISPHYDRMSTVVLPFFVKLISHDQVQYHDAVKQIFGHPSWEVRFQCLDSVFGILSKLDRFITDEVSPSPKITIFVGSVFSCLVASMWDEEESVRTKAKVYLKVLQPVHVHLALHVWELYFIRSDIEEQQVLVRLMAQLNNFCPALSVMSYSVLYNLLAPNGSIVSTSGAVTDIKPAYFGDDLCMTMSNTEEHLARGMHSNINPVISTVQEDQRNKQPTALDIVRCGLLSLFLQMVANGVEPTRYELNRLRFLTAYYLGFDTVVDAAMGNIGLQYSEQISITRKGPIHDMYVHMICMKLKLILDRCVEIGSSETDSFVSRDSFGSIGTDISEEKVKEVTKSESLVGTQFVNMILSFFGSESDLTQFRTNILKNWLELFLIVIYKYIQAESGQIWDLTVVLMKRVVDVLNKDIAEENVVLAISICATLLERSATMTALVLSRQITALGKLMTKRRHDPEDLILNKAQNFLHDAFVQFVGNGLFVLVFKQDQDQEFDLFYVLENILRDEKVLLDPRGPSVNLLDQPIRDIIDRTAIFRDLEPSEVSTVLKHLAQYVEQVHPRVRDEGLLPMLTQFLLKTAKATQDWDHRDWDVNPLLRMCAVLMRHHPYEGFVLVMALKVLLRQVLYRSRLTALSLISLCAAYTYMAELDTSLDVRNAFGEVIVEELRASLKGKVKIMASNVKLILLLLEWDLDPENVNWSWYLIKQSFLEEMRFPPGGQPLLFPTATADLRLTVSRIIDSTDRA